MKSLFKCCVPLLATALLASCGGGGGSEGNGGFTPATGSIHLSAVTQDLPLNSLGADPNPGGPFTTEVSISVRMPDGSLASEIEEVQVSINPASVATFSTLDDPETDDVNEILLRLGQAPVDVVAGTATVFVTSYQSAGTATLTVDALPVETGEPTFQSASMEFTVGNVGAPTPRNVSVTSDYPGVYLASSGGRSTTLLTALVTDAGNQTVPDSEAPNVQFEVVGDASNGSLSGGDSQGQVVQVNSTKGIAHASFKAGTAQGPVTVKVTADGADNDVSNGIDDPVSATIAIVVSDGRLYGLEITSPVFATKLPGITVNSLPVSEDAEPSSGSTSMIPPDPDATLSLTVSVLATDRQGNPVLPGTTIRFGSVDEPVADFDEAGGGNYFQIAGTDGDPAEGGTLFTAPTGNFTTGGGGAGPGDALVVFGEAVEGNANLESALTVQTINSDTSLHTTSSFNLNDTTGSSVDNGAVLPYLVGRSQHGNITATATTNELGVASAKLTYTVNTVGHAVAIWAQGIGADRVTDALTLTYPGVAPAALMAFPSPIPGNTTTEVTVCLSDALGIPLRGFPIDFAFQLPAGSGSIDGVSNSGTMSHFTGADGCTTGEVETSGLPASASGDSGSILFSAAGATAEVAIKFGVSFLQASPNRVCSAADPDGDPATDDASPGTITVTAFADNGGTASGVNISASCDGSATVTPASGVTGASGSVSFDIVVGDGEIATCTFSSADGLVATAQVSGSGAGGFSPVCP